MPNTPKLIPISPESFTRFPRRLQDTLILVTCGLDNAEIALILEITKKTARNYVSQLYQTFDAGHRSELIHIGKQLILEEEIPHSRFLMQAARKLLKNRYSGPETTAPGK